jgi:hypothetical protein
MSMDAESGIPDGLLEWRWPADGSDSGFGMPDGRSLHVAPARRAPGLTIRLVDAAFQTVWARGVRDADAWSATADEESVYVVLHRRQVTGARLEALDIRTGRQRWAVALEGLGPLHHSKYRNLTRAGLVGNAVVVYGDESGGRYCEARAAGDGRLLGRREFAAVEGASGPSLGSGA